MSPELLRTGVMVAGISQLALALASLAIPAVLGWKAELAKVRPLTREVFWTYAGYIWATNVAFGLVSTLFPAALLDGSPLAGCVTAFIMFYWGARCLIQWFFFDRSDAPTGWHVTVAEMALNLLFVALTGIYGAACWINFWGSSP
jgi:hypothetical protein